MPTITNILRIWKDTEATNRYIGVPYPLIEGLSGYKLHQGSELI